MACPLFLPSRPLSEMLYDGQCAASPEAGIPEHMLRQCCNRGYARGICPRAARSEADAFRFLVTAAREDSVEVAWSMERDHHPLAVGAAVFTKFTPEDNDPLHRQARAYAIASTLLRP